MPPTPHSPDLLARPIEQRLREYKYRFSQSIVFGLPVIGLHFCGPLLGPADWQRWVSLLQALLAGWVVYVNLGMLFEGVIALCWRKLLPDLVIITLAAGLYLYSAAVAIPAIINNRLSSVLLFHACVALLAGWTGLRWWRLSRVI